MEQRITHACGHEQEHHLTGFASQQDRKARWLRTTRCRACFIAEKQAEQASAAARAEAAIAHIDLPSLTGSDRQIAWAATIRAGRLAGLITDGVPIADTHRACVIITDAKWWIDHRDLTDCELLDKACLAAPPASSVPAPPPVVLPHAA